METKAEIRRLIWDMAMWDFAYREKHTKDKTESELLATGWEKDCNGDWCHERMERARSTVFRERDNELSLKILLQG